MRSDWLTTSEFAEIATISRRVATRLLADFGAGRKAEWRGVVLVVKEASGRGGKGGLTYKVALSSLPNELQSRLDAPKNLMLPALNPEESAREAVWWHHQISPLLNHPHGSVTRAKAIAAIVDQTIMDWNNKPRRLTRSTVYAKIKDLEQNGIGALSRSRRRDAGNSRVFVSKKWDSAVPFDDDLKRKLAHNALLELRAVIGGDRPLTRSLCLLLATEHLAEQTEAYGFRSLAREALLEVCAIPMEWYHKNRHWKKLAEDRHDKKKSFDANPVVKRTTKGLTPSHTVTLDVHHCNVLVSRENGDPATPKFIAFYDNSTHRVWVETVFFEKNGGVRNIDVIQAYANMAMDPSWGLPQILQCDNGMENQFAGYLSDGMALTATMQGSRERISQILKALPRRGRSKPIERLFGHFEQHYLSTFQGYIGDDRMNPKEAELGKLPAPYPGGIEAFNEAVQQMVRLYHSLPQSGELAGKSPNQALQEHIQDGWAASVMDPENLLTAFTKPMSRQLRNHAFKLGGRTWTCCALDRFMEDRVIVRVPQLGLGYNELHVESVNGEFIGIATPQEVFDFHDARGVQSSFDRNKEKRESLRQMRKMLPKRDVHQQLLSMGASVIEPQPNPPSGVVRIGQAETAKVIIPSEIPHHDFDARREEERAQVEFMIANLGKKAVP